MYFQRVPQVNTVWQEDEATSVMNVDISVAVATDNGLITPIVKNTPRLGVDEISAIVKVKIFILLTWLYICHWSFEEPFSQ